MPRLCALVLLTSLTAFAVVATAQEPKKEKPALKKYVGVYTKTYPKKQIILQDPKIRQLGNHTFLVGTPVGVSMNGTKFTPKQGVSWSVALSEVIEFYEFSVVKGFQYDGTDPRFVEL
jgi:hypothetical protein